MFRIFAWTNNSGVGCGVRDWSMVPWIVNHVSMLKSNRSVTIELEMALFGFNISLPAWIVEYIKLNNLWVIVLFAYETNACKFSTSFNFCGRERSFHIVNIPIIVIKPEACFKCDFVTEVFFVAKFSMYGVCAYSKSLNL